MNKLFKRVISGMTVLAVVANLALSATAVSWEAKDINYSGNTSGDIIDYVTLQQTGSIARAICNSVSHSSTYAYTEYTNIDCVSHQMVTKKIIDTGLIDCNAAVGTILTSVNVQYKVTAHTEHLNDTFTSKGNIFNP